MNQVLQNSAWPNPTIFSRTSETIRGRRPRIISITDRLSCSIKPHEGEPDCAIEDTYCQKLTHLSESIELEFVFAESIDMHMGAIHLCGWARRPIHTSQQYLIQFIPSGFIDHSVRWQMVQWDNNSSEPKGSTTIQFDNEGTLLTTEGVRAPRLGTVRSDAVPAVYEHAVNGGKIMDAVQIVKLKGRGAQS